MPSHAKDDDCTPWMEVRSVRAAVLAGKKLETPIVIFRVCANNVLVPTPK